MKYKKTNEAYIIKLELGEEVIEELIEFCTSQNISAAYFNGIGAVSRVKLSFYKLGTKEYASQVFDEPLEIASFSGNVALFDNQIKLHCHGAFSREDFSTIAGHVDELIVAATTEIILIPLKTELKRKFDSKIGLNLLDF